MTKLAKTARVKYRLHEPREGRAIATILDPKVYTLLGKDESGRDIYTLRERPGFLYALADGMKMAWRVNAIKPAMEMDPKFKKPQRMRVKPMATSGSTRRSRKKY